MSITPKNWGEFQHYKDRAPAWIKLHRGLLDNFDFHRLPVASRALAPMLWLLASEYGEGQITASIEEIAFRFRMPIGDLKQALRPLVDSGFFVDSDPLADCKHDAIPEKEREEEEEKRETRARDDWPDDYRERFWALYPNKVGKSLALQKLDLTRKRGVSFKKIEDAIAAYVRDKPPDRQWCNPATWLNQGRWEDEPANIGQSNAAPGSKIIQAADDLRRKIASFDGRTGEIDGLRSGEGASSPRLLSHG